VVRDSLKAGTDTGVCLLRQVFSGDDESAFNIDFEKIGDIVI